MNKKKYQPLQNMQKSLMTLITFFLKSLMLISFPLLLKPNILIQTMRNHQN